MLRQDDHVPITSITFEFEDATETDVFNKVNKLTKPTAIRPLLCNDLRAVRDAFKSPRVRLESKTGKLARNITFLERVCV